MARRPPADPHDAAPVIRVRRIHRRDLNRVWEFLKKVFRSVNKETVEYQRPRTKTRFLEIYEEEGIEQLLFEVHQGPVRQVVGYAECAYEVIGSDNWINERYFDNRDMRPLFVEEIAIHPGFQGRGIGSFVIEQLEHLARVHGCTHLVLEVAANNKRALQFYRARSFAQLDAAIFLAKKVISEPELLPPRALLSGSRDDLVLDEPDEPVADTVETLARELDAPAPATKPRKRRAEPVPRDISAKHRAEPAPEDTPRKRRAEPVLADKPAKRATKPAPAAKPRKRAAEPSLATKPSKRAAEPVPEDTPRKRRAEPAPTARNRSAEPDPVDMPDKPSRKSRGEPRATEPPAPRHPPVKASTRSAPAKPRTRKPSR